MGCLGCLGGLVLFLGADWFVYGVYCMITTDVSRGLIMILLSAIPFLIGYGIMRLYAKSGGRW
jgi:hypothetical protein